MSDDSEALQELYRFSKPGTPHLLLHYLYVPGKEAAAKVIPELRKQGFETEDRLGADGVNWLILARHKVVPMPQLLAGIRKQMKDLVDEVNGEYDGWEAEVD